jgi:DNA-3-methyladenine glycosylase I
VLPPAAALGLRCPWAETSDLLRAFHDHEWGEPVQEADILFEYLILHTFQLGFNFPVVLKYREAMRELLAGFEPARLARFGEAQITALLANPRMLRSRRKLEAAIQNARAWLQLRQEMGGSEASLLAFFFAYVGGAPLDGRREASNLPPISTPASVALSHALKRRGFAQLGPANCYALLQTAGLVNDHLLSCPRHVVCAALPTP